MPRIRFLVAALITLVTGSFALAHDPGLSSAHVVRIDDCVEVQLAFAWTDVAALTSENTATARPDAARLTALLQSTGELVQIELAGTQLRALGPIISPGQSDSADVIVLMRWAQVPRGDLRMKFPVLARMPFGHRMMLTVGNAVEPVGLLDARHTTWDLTALPDVRGDRLAVPSTYPARASTRSFVVLGIEHILTGFDHLCFLFALLLVATRFRDVLTVVTTFTIAHSMTLAAAAFGAVHLSSSIVEPLIAASIVYIGLENLFLRRQPRRRLVLVFGFGLIHGLGFAGALADRLPGVTGFAVVPPLLGFNAGVECGQLAVAACLVPLIRLARGRPEFSGKLQPVCSLAIAAAGFVWLVQRV